MGVINVKEGADLTHPKATSGWMVGAVVAGVLLFAALGIAGYLYGKGKSAISGAGKTATAGATGMFAGAFGDGT